MTGGATCSTILATYTPPGEHCVSFNKIYSILVVVEIVEIVDKSNTIKCMGTFFPYYKQLFIKCDHMICL